MGVLDFRRFMPPGTVIGDGVYTIPTSGPGTFTVPTAAITAAPPPENTPKPIISGDTNPAGKPPVMTSFGGIHTMAPIGTAAVVRPPTEPAPVIAGQPSAYGPGPSQPEVTGAPVTPPLGFGNPVTEKAIDRITTGVATPMGQPTLDKPETWYDRLAKVAGSDNFAGAAKALSGAFGGKKGAPPAPFRVSGSSGGGGGVKDFSGQGAQILAGILKGRQAEGDLGQKKKRRKAQDRFEGMPGEGRR